MPAGISLFGLSYNSILDLILSEYGAIIDSERGDIMNQIGQRMRELRESVHLSQADIAKLCGSNQSTIGKTEKGLTAPSVKLLVWYADYFDISMDYLCCRTDQPQGKLYKCKPQLKYSNKDMRQFIEMCFDPSSPYNEKLKAALFEMMEASQK